MDPKTFFKVAGGLFLIIAVLHLLLSLFLFSSGGRGPILLRRKHVVL